MIKRPTILSIAGFDPSGGAGIQADIETINRLGGHCCSIITAITVQDSNNLYSFQPVSTELIQRQFHCLIKDFSIKAIKIGLIGNSQLIKILSELISFVPEVPVILDPVLSAGGGTSVSNQEFISELKQELLPKLHLITPNIPEALQITHTQHSHEAAKELLALGCNNVLITGTHSETTNIQHLLYKRNSDKLSFHCDRLEYDYHGSGCTLSSAISYFIASNHSLTNAIKLAQDFTFSALKQADHPGHGQYFPVRNHSIL